MKPLESVIQKSILDYLETRHIPHWRQNTQGRVIKKNGEKIYIPTAGMTGIADILGFYRGSFFALEVKRPGEKPTPDQVKFLQMVTDQGHIAKVVYGVQDVISVLQ